MNGCTSCTDIHKGLRHGLYRHKHHNVAQFRIEVNGFIICTVKVDVPDIM